MAFIDFIVLQRTPFIKDNPFGTYYDHVPPLPVFIFDGMPFVPSVLGRCSGGIIFSPDTNLFLASQTFLYTVSLCS